MVYSNIKTSHFQFRHQLNTNLNSQNVDISSAVKNIISNVFQNCLHFASFAFQIIMKKVKHKHGPTFFFMESTRFCYCFAFRIFLCCVYFDLLLANKRTTCSLICRSNQIQMCNSKNNKKHRQQQQQKSAIKLHLNAYCDCCHRLCADSGGSIPFAITTDIHMSMLRYMRMRICICHQLHCLT